MLTVSPTSAASRSQISRPCWVTSSRPDTALAKRKSPNPSRYLPRSWACSTNSRSSSAPSNRNAVDLCTPMSAASSVTPVSPRRARISNAYSARSTDCTPLLPASDVPLLMTQQYSGRPTGLPTGQQVARCASKVWPWVITSHAESGRGARGRAAAPPNKTTNQPAKAAVRGLREDRPCDSSPMTGTVAVIGAGPGGLVAARWLLSQGFEVTIYEQAPMLGGQWTALEGRSGVWPTMHTNTSRIMTAFSDLEHDSDLVYPSNRDILDYLHRYAATFGLTPRIRFGNRVELLQRDGARWL